MRSFLKLGYENEERDIDKNLMIDFSKTSFDVRDLENSLNWYFILVLSKLIMFLIVLSK